MTLRLAHVLTIAMSAAAAIAEEPPPLESPQAKQSYVLGVNFGRGLRQEAVELDRSAFDRGLADGLAGAEAELSEDEISELISALRGELRDRREAARAGTLEQSLRAEEAFLAANGREQGVVSLESGVQYRILEAGEGRRPALTDTVVCDYTGRLVDGTLFAGRDSTGRSQRLPVWKMVPGLREALSLMPEGSRWEVFVPSALGYGSRGAGRSIGPNATLIFDIAMTSIEGGAEDRTDAGTAASDLRFSFKLDPRLLGGTYGGVRWVAPPRFTGASAQDRVDVRVEAVDSTGASVAARSRWTPADPEMVTISPQEGEVVEIRVNRPGQSAVEVAAGGLSRTLLISATQQGQSVQLEISQPQSD